MSKKTITLETLKEMIRYTPPSEETSSAEIKEELLNRLGGLSYLSEEPVHKKPDDYSDG